MRVISPCEEDMAPVAIRPNEGGVSCNPLSPCEGGMGSVSPKEGNDVSSVSPR